MRIFLGTNVLVSALATRGLCVVRTARDLLGRSRLRAADALQLASSLELQRRLQSPVRFVAFDRDLNEAARREGVEVIDAGTQGA